MHPLWKRRSGKSRETEKWNTKVQVQKMPKWNKRHCKGFRDKQRYSYETFKKTEKSLTSVNPKYVKLEEPLTVRLEMDEMWGRVYSKETPCWLWHAINHENGELIAYVLGSREHGMLQQLLELLKGLNLNIVSVYSDNNFAYHDGISPEIL